MDDNLGYLFAAFAVTWLGIAGYLLYLGQQVKALREDVQAIDRDADA
jgi:CcmD family protein